MDQLPYVLEILREDPDSRQAVLTIWRERPRVTKDVPCTVMMQFLLRRGLLHMHVYMRSNDVWLGTPYDIYNFTLVQQVVACLLNCDVGTYTHTVGSFHLYERHVDGANEALGSTRTADVPMPRVRSVPLGLMTAAYTEAAVRGKSSGFNAEAWTEKWLRELCHETDYIQPWSNMIRVLGHRFNTHIPTDWGRLFEVGRA
jgi:thymidylate synthase